MVGEKYATPVASSHQRYGLAILIFTILACVIGFALIFGVVFLWMMRLSQPKTPAALFPTLGGGKGLDNLVIHGLFRHS